MKIPVALEQKFAALEHRARERRLQAEAMQRSVLDADNNAAKAEAIARQSLNPADAEKAAQLRLRADSLRKCLPSEAELISEERAVLHSPEAVGLLRELQVYAESFVLPLRQRAVAAAQDQARLAIEDPEGTPYHASQAKASEELQKFQVYRENVGGWPIEAIAAGQTDCHARANYKNAKQLYENLLSSLPSDVKAA